MTNYRDGVSFQLHNNIWDNFAHILYPGLISVFKVVFDFVIWM